MANIENGKLMTISRSGKFIINFGKIDLQNIPGTFDLGVTPNDIIKVMGKKMYISWIVGMQGNIVYQEAPVLFTYNESVPYYEITFDIALGDETLVFSSNDANSTIWTRNE